MSLFQRPRSARGERSIQDSPRAIVARACGPETADEDVTRSLAELAQLLGGLGIEVVGQVIQRRGSGHSPAYLGGGKLRELAAMTGGPGDLPRGPGTGDARHRDTGLVVVADDELSPGQQRNLERALACEVLDRTAVVLRTFEARARSPQARLEVQLARLEYELPRIRDDHSLGDREGGGGRAARGHTNVELAKQRTRARIAAIRREIDALAVAARHGRARRSEMLRVALVGYTNAGKSALMRRLTGADVLVQDRLFATLGTTVRQVVPAAHPPVVVADTVGFLERLPHRLIASFRSTLTEAVEAWLLVQVVDASDPAFPRHIQVTEGTLDEIGASDVPRQLVLNKADRVGEAARETLRQEHPGALVMSALDEGDGRRLRARIDGFFSRYLRDRSLVVPYARAGVLAAFRDKLQVLDETHGQAITVRVRGLPSVIQALEAKVRAP